MIIFAHDHKLRYDNGIFFTQGGLADNITQRYTTIYGDLTIICRAISIKPDEKNLSRIENPLVRVNAVRSSSLIISGKDKQKIRETVGKSDGVIVRLPSIIGEEVFKCAKQLKKPVLAEIVTCPWDSLWNHSLKGKVIAPVMWFKTRKSTKSADYVLYVTQQFLQRRYPTNGINIGCSDVELIDNKDNILESRLESIDKKAENDEFILGTLASLNTKFKGQQYVMEAIAKLKSDGKKIKYRLAGGGDASYLHSVAKKLDIEDLIIWDGLVPHKDVFDWFAKLDLYIQPSEQEGLPRALVEAMSRACPCAGSDVGGIPELLQPEDIFKRSSWNSIYSYLKKIRKDKLKANAKHNYEKAQEYTKTSLAPIREKFYKDFKSYIESR